jgi:hypothetical protein
VIASIAEVAAIAPWAFLLGCLVGFIGANRWRITRRKED